MRGRVHRSTAPSVEAARASFHVLPKLQLPPAAVDLLCLLGFLAVFCVVAVVAIMVLVWFL